MPQNLKTLFVGPFSLRALDISCYRTPCATLLGSDISQKFGMRFEEITCVTLLAMEGERARERRLGLRKAMIFVSCVSLVNQHVLGHVFAPCPTSLLTNPRTQNHFQFSGCLLPVLPIASWFLGKKLWS